jgi:hypothetical protein
MVVHQAIGVDDKTIPGHPSGHGLQKSTPVTVIEKYLLARIPA